MSCYYVKETVNISYMETGFGVENITHDTVLKEGDILGIGLTYAMLNFIELESDSFGADIIVLNEAEIAEKSVRITSNDYDRFKENHYFINKYQDAMVEASEKKKEEMNSLITKLEEENAERISKIISKTYRSKSELLKKYDKEVALSHEIEKEIDLKKKELEELLSHIEKIKHDIKQMVRNEGDVAKIIPHKGYVD